MRRLVFMFALAAFGLSGTALSAQGDYYGMYDDDACCCEKPLFNGLYVGGNVGVISHASRHNDFDGFFSEDNSSWSLLRTGVTGGGQIGYDMQCGSRVLGLVWDFNGTRIRTKFRNDPNVATSLDSLHHRAAWWSSIRARAGIEVCKNLLYVTVGPVVARYNTRWRNTTDDFHFHHHRWGWMGGVGAEFGAFTNITVGADVFFAHFTDRVQNREVGTARFAFGRNDSFWGSRLIVNYRFGSNLFGNLFSCCR